MRIICCRCGKEYRLQGNLFEAEIANKPVLKCPHCGSLHLVDFTPTKKDHSDNKLSQLKLTDYYAAMGGSRICSATRVDLSGADDVDVVKPAADDFIVAVNINSAGKDTVAAQYKLRWRDYGEVAGTYHFDVSDAGPTDTQGVWTNDSWAFDGVILSAYKASCSTSGSSTLNALQGDGTNAPASGDAITDVRVRIYGYNGTAGDTLKAKVWKDGRTEVLGTVSNTLTAAGWSDWLTLDAPAAGWDWATVQGLDVDIYTEISTTGTAYAYKVEIDVMKGGSAFVDVGATGEIHYNADTDLVNGAAIAVGGRKCDSQGGDTWQDGEEVEGASLCDSIDLADEYETEIHFALDSSGAENGHKYEFELWDVTKDASRGTLGATVRIADEIDSYPKSNYDTYSQIYSASLKAVGQSFTCDTAKTLDSCKFYLRDAGSPTGMAVAKIYAHSGTYGTSSLPTGSVLATSDGFDVSTLTGEFRLIVFEFSGADRISLSASTYYVLTIEYNAGDASNNVLVAEDETSPTHDGNYVKTWDLTSWYAAARDLIFYIYGIEAAGTTVSDTRFARTAGKETTDSERLARSHGKDTDDSTRDGRTRGGQAETSERDGRTAGVDTQDDERDVRTAGADTQSDERDLRTHGQETDSSERDVRTAGEETALSERDARTEGSDGGTQVSDTREVRTAGEDTQDSERDGRTSGKETASSERDARARGGDEVSSERDVRTAGVDTLASERDVRTLGSEDDDSERDGRTAGKETASSERYGRTEGYEAGTQESSERDGRTAGEDILSSERDVRTKGGDDASDERDVRTAGEDTQASTRDVRTAGQDEIASERDGRTRGGVVVSSERYARTEGFTYGLSPIIKNLAGGKNYEAQIYSEGEDGYTPGWEDAGTFGIDDDGTFLPGGY